MPSGRHATEYTLPSIESGSASALPGVGSNNAWWLNLAVSADSYGV